MAAVGKSGLRPSPGPKLLAPSWGSTAGCVFALKTVFSVKQEPNVCLSV